MLNYYNFLQLSNEALMAYRIMRCIGHMGKGAGITIGMQEEKLTEYKRVSDDMNRTYHDKKALSKTISRYEDIIIDVANHGSKFIIENAHEEILSSIENLIATQFCGQETSISYATAEKIEDHKGAFHLAALIKRGANTLEMQLANAAQTTPKYHEPPPAL